MAYSAVPESALAYFTTISSWNPVCVCAGTLTAMLQPVKRETIDLTGFDSGSDQGGLEDYSEPPHLADLPTRPERRQRSEDGLDDLPLARRMPAQRAGDEGAAAGCGAHGGHDSRSPPRQPKLEAHSGTLQTILNSFPAPHVQAQRNGLHHSDHTSATATKQSRGVTSLGQTTEAKQSAKPVNGTRQQDTSMLWPAESSWCAAPSVSCSSCTPT